MLFDRTLIEHGKKTEEVYILPCPEWSEKFFFTELQKLNYDYEKMFKLIEHLKQAIVDYIDYYNNKRIKTKLKGLSPVQYRTKSFG